MTYLSKLGIDPSDDDKIKNLFYEFVAQDKTLDNNLLKDFTFYRDQGLFSGIPSSNLIEEVRIRLSEHFDKACETIYYMNKNENRLK